MMNPIFCLEELGLRDAPRVGKEAAALGELFRMGAPVSAAFAIPNTSYAEYINQPVVRDLLERSNFYNSEELGAHLLVSPVPNILERSLRLSYRALSGPRDIFVLVRGGHNELRALGEEELIHSVKRIWVDHLIQLLLSGRKVSHNPLPIFVQQVERCDFHGRLLTSDCYTNDPNIAVVEVDYERGKEKFFFGKDSARLIKRLVVGEAEKTVTLEQILPIVSWAAKVEDVLESSQEVGWGLCRDVFTFSRTKPLLLATARSNVTKLWVRVVGGDTPVPIEAAGIFAPTASCAAVLAWKFSDRPIFLELTGLDESELATIREARNKEGQQNLHLILPPIRTVDGLKEAKRIIAGEGLPRGPHLKYFLRLAFPANVVLLERLLGLEVDGAVLDGMQLARGFLGANNSAGLDDSMLWAVGVANRCCRAAGVELLFYGLDLGEESVAKLLHEGVTQIVVDAGQEKVLLPLLSRVEERVLKAASLDVQS